METNQNFRGLFSFFERNHFFDINKVYNDFIKNELNENEYVININYMKDGSRLKPYEKGRADVFETVVVAIVHIGEK